MIQDPYFKKTIELNYHKHHLIFHVANTIFSTFDIDDGTQLLLRTAKLKEGGELLDLGCGYGALGIIFSKLFNLKNITMVDKDMLSIKYAKANAKENNVENIEFVPSVGLENVPLKEYDNVVSNIPAKVGDKAIEEEFILKPLAYLKPEGEYWFVVVSALNRIVPTVGEKHKLNMELIIKKNRYSVYKITKNA